MGKAHRPAGRTTGLARTENWFAVRRGDCGARPHNQWLALALTRRLKKKKKNEQVKTDEQEETVEITVGFIESVHHSKHPSRLFASSSYEAMLVDEATYVCCKGFHAINIRAIGYHNMMIRHLIAKWPGSTLMLLSLKQGRILVKCHIYFKAFPTK